MPKEELLQFIGSTIQIEEQNKEMNVYLERLVEKLRREDVYTVLVKGQGIARCYERPLWRACGDIDLLLSDNNYTKAAEILKKEAVSAENENRNNRHLSMNIDGWTVELHGTLSGGLWHRLDKEIDKVQDSVFYGGECALMDEWKNKGFPPSR